MAFTQRLRAAVRRAFPAIPVLLLAACATRQPGSVVPVAAIAATAVWRIEEGDIVRTRVFQQPDLAAEGVVGPTGTAFFPGLGRVAVVGLSVDSLEALLNSRYATLVRNAAVQVTMQREITLYGQVRQPGVYTVDPGTTLLGLVARAGGPAASGSTPDVTLEKADGQRLRLPREVRLGNIDLHRTDAVYLADQGFFLRNANAIGATQIVVSMLSTVVSLILIVSR